MSQKPFSAGLWFGRDIDAPFEAGNSRAGHSVSTDSTLKQPKYKFPTFNNPLAHKQNSHSITCEGFQPTRFLTPGWRGESLPSKISGRFLRLVEILQKDVFRLLVTQDFNRSLKLGIYNEFLVYAKDKGLHCPELDDITRFWHSVRHEERPEALTRFLSIFSSRVAVITLFKLRFIKVLSQNAGIEANTRTAHNPNHWLSQVFRNGTRFELKARVMESNVFSWYRPGEDLSVVMNEWMQQAGDLSISELIKLTSPQVQDGTSSKVYSHALSHLNFGLFLNSLMINFPLWAESREPTPSHKFLTPDELEIISCKYSGDFMESLALSHWLAQHNNKELKWDQVLCPDFKGKEFESGLFLKMLNELQFITFLAEIAPHQGQEPTDFISKVMGHHFQNRKNTQGQRGFASLETPFSTSTYDRTILNLCHLPKNNPYHWMMTQIEEQRETLKPGGWLFMFASKNLFAPSQRERLQAVLQGLELKAVFDMEGVKGKGEMGHWLYIFRRRSRPASVDMREGVAWFRFTADMQTFNDFSDITELLRGFYLSHLEDTPAMWQQEWGRDFRLEFFQDAVMDGHLFHSANDDQSRVTHPRFFKALMSNCVPLDTVFDLRPMNPEEWQSAQSMGLGLRRDGATFLMVDVRSPGHTVLSLHPVSTFRAVYYESGSSLCQYFLIASKHHSMDPNVLRKYFASQIGHQIINLTFNGTSIKIKGQLAKMLVPKWFARSEFLPDTLKTTLEMFHWGQEKLIATHPDELKQRFQMFLQTAQGLFPRYACDVLSGLVEFEQTLKNLTNQLADPRLGMQIDFHNPALQVALTQLKAFPLLHPTHPDLYVDFIQGIDSLDLEAPMSRVELRTQVEGDTKSWFLEIFNERRPVVRLHSDEELLLFTQFVLHMAQGRPLGQTLRALRIPALPEVQALVQQARSQQQVFVTLLKETESFLEESFRLQMLSVPG